MSRFDTAGSARTGKDWLQGRIPPGQGIFFSPGPGQGWILARKVFHKCADNRARFASIRRRYLGARVVKQKDIYLLIGVGHV